MVEWCQIKRYIYHFARPSWSRWDVNSQRPALHSLINQKSAKCRGPNCQGLLVGAYLFFCFDTFSSHGNSISFLSMNSTSVAHSHLAEFEIWWRDRYNFLEEKGYKLRSRYSPDWVPSWTNTNKVDINCEDGISSPVSASSITASIDLSCILQHYLLLDARRIRDGARVLLKCIDVLRHPYEIEIGRYFCSSSLSEDPANHCVPIYDVLEVPNADHLMILVMPLLRNATDPYFDTVGEVVDCIHQLFEVRPSFRDLHFS